MNYLAEVSDSNFIAEIYVQWEAVNPVQHMSFTNLLHDITQRNVVDTQDSDEDDEGYGQTTQEHHFMPPVDNIVGLSSQFLVGDNNNDGFDDSESCSTEESSESEEAPPSDDGTSDDEAAVNQHTQLTLAQPRPIIPGTHEDPNEDEELRDYMCPDYEDNPMDVWNPKVKQIRLGMYFKSKQEVDLAIREWNIRRGREIFVTDSKPTLYKVKCYTRNKNFKNPFPHARLCEWRATASKQKHQHLWQITNWAPAHSCYSTAVRNNNRCLRSKDIAAHILPQIRTDIALKVKHIRTHIKQAMSVDVTYTKAWHGRRKAIERIYGTWESNFQELPKYVLRLQSRNPGTVVSWFHHPHSAPGHPTFKYVFWAFGPSIRAFHLCQPVISVDGTHLKGGYRGKLLVAVTKNANNYIMPVAYALVDEETVHSWCWFFQNLKECVTRDCNSRICVLSDRHARIINAMENLVDWREPNAYHRYCLRHVRSNFSGRFKTKSLRKLCWMIGSTSQRRKYVWAVREMQMLNQGAWNYLNDIDKSKWTIVHDRGNRRWGNITTNISESMNNVLREARLLPVKSLIHYTFTKDVSEYARHAQMAQSCNTPLPPQIWSRFNKLHSVAMQHEVSVYDVIEGRYAVVSREETNDDGGNEYTVEYRRSRCSCGKWQMLRFPCSHAIAICCWRGEQPHDVTNSIFHTTTY
ncbi:uncharacterized protein LOC110901845 [Helianthus annuus]|uniref:uncharacterized protein LOC110901845 n=1 Tax=Helianthus annuus TaxID=4232 RepID=UPI000B8EE921|nr:uncharacterized protein LOC110901845 [Helianthus annuus]